ncbi:MAG: hypothetical protein NTZ67_02845 [Gammaproteobacteria bacterium]|nr:hypothetical protein [Gammaproteobacteria bacterium]
MKQIKARLLEEQQNLADFTYIITISDHNGRVIIGSPLLFSKDSELMRHMQDAHCNRIYYLAAQEKENQNISCRDKFKTHNTC